MSRCEDSNRVARHWLVLAVATRWVLDCGTRVDDVAQLETTSDRVRVPPDLPSPTERATTSLFQRGMRAARRQLGHGRIWQWLWLRPSDLPGPYPGGIIITHHDPESDIQAERYIPQ
jgi:hypothetical protein